MKIGQIAKQQGAGVAAKVEPSPELNPMPGQTPAVAEEQPAAPTLPGGEHLGQEVDTSVALDQEPNPTPSNQVPLEIEAGDPGEPDLDVVATKEEAIPTSGFLLRGTKAAAARQVEQTRVEQAQSGFRFFIEVGKEARITFVDGALDLDGALDCPQWYEHRLFIANRMTAVVCYETLTGSDTMGPCPVCDAGHQTQYVGAMTIINHTPYSIKTGQNAGKILQHRRQQLIAPRSALETLQKLATKRGGLVAHCFDVYRKEDKDPRVGSVWDWVGQLTKAQVEGLGEEWKPYEWDKEMKMLPPDQMAKLGSMATPYRPKSGGGKAATVGTGSINI